MSDPALPLCFDGPASGLGPHVLAALARDGIAAPTPVQAAAWGPLLAGRDAVLQSATGSGKTLAYLLPLLQRVAAKPAGQILVLAPSPELAAQIARVAEAYAPPGFGCAGLIGGGSLERQRDRLKRHPRVLVGTPGRVLDLIGARKVKAARLAAVVLDEVDMVLGDGLAVPLGQVLSRPEVSPQIVCASATFGAAARAFVAQRLAPDHAVLTLAGVAVPDAITHAIASYDRSRKEVSLAHLLRDGRVRRGIVFVARQGQVAHLSRFLCEHGVAATGLSATAGKQARVAAVAALRGGRVQVVVATDMAARGLDVPGLDTVVHYDPARDPETYVHRAGRAGRAGAPGHSVTMAVAGERAFTEKLGRNLGLSFAAADAA